MPPKRSKPTTDRMSGAALAAIRVERDETGEAFGAHLAQITGHHRPYSRQEVWGWESELRPIPAKIELALIKAKAK